MTRASDPMGVAATAAAAAVSRMDFRLLAAGSAALSREERADYLQRVFSQWALVCRAMSDLEAVAPRASAAGAEWAAKLKDHAERHLGVASVPG